MVSQDQLKDLLSKPGYKKTDKLLICLAVDPETPKPVGKVRDLAQAAGLRAARSWNISQLFSGSRGLAIRTTAGWELTSAGKAHVMTLAGPIVSSPVAHVIPQLRAHLSQINQPSTAAFIEEAIRCLEFGLLRAGVVLSWIGAVGVLYDYVVANSLSSFNVAAQKRFPAWKLAKTADDLARMKEADFLLVLEDISAIGKSVKQELEGCLKLRNAAGHPNQLRIGESRAAGHVESLILNVFAQFT